MSKPTTQCPHCGKLLSSPDKLAWHLARECAGLVAITQSNVPKKHQQPAQSGSGD